MQFYETDAQGIVHHSNYLRYFEEARGELLRFLGLPYSHLRKKGYEVVLLEAQCQFLKPIYYDEEIKIELNLSNINRFTFSFEYLVSSSGLLKAKGYTKHCLIREGRIVSIPLEVKEKLNLFFSNPCKHS